MVGIFSLGSEQNINSLQKSFSELINLQNKLSTGKKINKASDGPAALVIAKRLESQVASFRQGVDNLQRSSNVLATAESALGETTSLLQKARSLIQGSSGAFSPAEREVNQQALNDVLSSIDRIAGSSNFAGINLLDGTQEPRVSNKSDEITDIRVDQVGNVDDLSRNVSVDISTQATYAEVNGTITAQTGNAEILIQGSIGAGTINLSDGATVADVENAINSLSKLTGVEAVGGKIRSRNLGRGETVTLRELSGSLDGITGSYAQGTDIEGRINGTEATGRGTDLTINNQDLNVTVTLDGSAAVGNYNFSLDSSGFNVNLGTGKAGAVRGLGIQRMASDSIGGTSALGTLASLRSGGANDLETNTANALAIVDAALSETSGARARMGAFQANTLSSLSNSFEVAHNNLEAARSRIEDTDFARTISEFVAAQVKQQVATALQAQIQGLNRSTIMGLLAS